jgi:peptidoglycan/LPS O-acetylase OafA/YrhL
MTAITKGSLAALALLAGVTLLAIAAFVAVSYTTWGWLSTLLGVVAVVLLVLCVRRGLDLLDRWLDRPDAASPARDRGWHRRTLRR